MGRIDVLCLVWMGASFGLIYAACRLSNAP